jgi:hypothetical protein
MSNDVVTAKMLNQLFLDRLGTVSVSGPKVEPNVAANAVFKFVYERVKDLYPDSFVKQVNLNKEAQLVGFSFVAYHKDKEIEGKEQWTEVMLLTTDEPMTVLIDKVIKDTFANNGIVPVAQLEKASLS